MSVEMIDLRAPAMERPGEMPFDWGLTVRVVTVTPEMARAWLATSDWNRSIKIAHMERMSRDMTNNDWLLTGETMIFDNKDHLVNGHHRCHACIRSQMPFQTLVIWGVDPITTKNVDRGSMRTAGDAFTQAGIEQGNQKAAICSYVWRHHNDRAIKGGGKSAPTIEECFETYLLYHREIDYSLKWANGATATGLTSPSLACFLHYTLAHIDGVAADFFFTGLYKGTGLFDGNPILALKSTLKTAKDKGVKLPPQLCAAYTYRTWNSWATGRSLGKVPAPRPGDPVPTPSPFKSTRWMVVLA